jgi:hypothetical protein
MGDVYPRFNVAAVQAASVMFDRDKTIDKAIRPMAGRPDKNPLEVIRTGNYVKVYVTAGVVEIVLLSEHVAQDFRTRIWRKGSRLS